jgi:hypothetical protein
MKNTPWLRVSMKRLIASLIPSIFCMALPASWAQTTTTAPTRLRGEIVQVNAQELVLKDRSGERQVVFFDDNLSIQEAYAVSIQSIQPNSYIGTAALAGSDGQLKALEVLVFPEAARGTGEGHFPWDLQPGSTMTNATVSQVDAKSTNYEMRLQYKGGEKSVVIPQGVPIVSIRPGNRSLLVPGAQVMIVANKEADHWKALRVTAGKDGFKPPM